MPRLKTESWLWKSVHVAKEKEKGAGRREKREEERKGFVFRPLLEGGGDQVEYLKTVPHF